MLTRKNLSYVGEKKSILYGWEKIELGERKKEKKLWLKIEEMRFKRKKKREITDEEIDLIHFHLVSK